MKKRFWILLTSMLVLSSITANATEPVPEAAPVVEEALAAEGAAVVEGEPVPEEGAEAPQPEAPVITYDEAVAFYGTPGETHRYEVFFDRTYPDIYFCLQNGTDVKFQAKDTEEENGTVIDVRQVEQISGQNFAVIYFTCGVEGTYTIEYSTSDCSTFVLVETPVREDYLTNQFEKRMEVSRTFYDIVGPYTDVSLETLLDVTYDPYADNAQEQIKDKVVDNTVYIPINVFTVSFVLLVIGSIFFYFYRKHSRKKKELQDSLNHKELLERITAAKIADDEQNDELSEYWNLIKNDYYDSPAG